MPSDHINVLSRGWRTGRASAAELGWLTKSEILNLKTQVKN